MDCRGSENLHIVPVRSEISGQRDQIVPFHREHDGEDRRFRRRLDPLSLITAIAPPPPVCVTLVQQNRNWRTMLPSISNKSPHRMIAPSHYGATRIVTAQIFQWFDDADHWVDSPFLVDWVRDPELPDTHFCGEILFVAKNRKRM